MRLGILSDTHNLLRDEVLRALEGCDCILHGGDICRPDIVHALEKIAPVYAVRGNADKEGMEFLPQYRNEEIMGLHVYMTHKKKDLPQDLTCFDLVVFGHSHQYLENRMGSTVLLNPGSCGPRRFYQPITMALIDIHEEKIQTTRIEIAHQEQKRPSGDMRSTIEIVLREYQRGNGHQTIAEKYGLEPETAEQIIRLYVTHPGVTVDGIMTKMGL